MVVHRCDGNASGTEMQEATECEISKRQAYATYIGRYFTPLLLSSVVTEYTTMYAIVRGAVNEASQFLSKERSYRAASVQYGDASRHAYAKRSIVFLPSPLTVDT